MFRTILDDFKHRRELFGTFFLWKKGRERKSAIGRPRYELLGISMRKVVPLSGSDHST